MIHSQQRNKLNSSWFHTSTFGPKILLETPLGMPYLSFKLKYVVYIPHILEYRP